MTITEFMNDLELESASAAFEMTCESVMCDFYAEYAAADEAEDPATESLSLAFDDDDIGAVETEPATEAGILKTIGRKFKEMIGNIKEWFEKMAKAIKEWIVKFVERVKTKIARANKKREDRVLSDAENDAKFDKADITARRKAINDKITELEGEYNKADANKKQQIRARINKLEAERDGLADKENQADTKLIATKAAIFSKHIQQGIDTAEKAFNSATKYEAMLRDMMEKIMSTKSGKKNLVSDNVDKTVGSYPSTAGYDVSFNKASASNEEKAAARSALKKANVSGYGDRLDNALDALDDILANVDKGVKQADDSRGQLLAELKKLGNPDAVYRAIVSAKVGIPSSGITAKAERMQKTCLELKSKADALGKLFETDSKGNDVEESKRPEIAKVLSTYSKVANKLVQVASKFLTMGSMSEVIVVS